LRVFDIRDLSAPRRSRISSRGGAEGFPSRIRELDAGVDRTYDKISGFARFKKVPANGTRGREMQIWLVSDGNGFQVVSFSDAFTALTKICRLTRPD